MALLLVGESGEVHHADPGVRDLLGVHEGACVGRNLGGLLPWEGIEGALREVSEGVVERRVLEQPVGERLMVASLTRAPAGAWGRQVSVLLTATDDPVGRQGGALKTTVESVISGFAHEVRNPIAAILSITEAVLGQIEPGGAPAAMLGRIPLLVTRVDKLIKQSLSYSRPKLPQRLPEPVRPLMGWAIELSQVKQSTLEIGVEVDDELGAVLVDAEQIEQVLANLLCNARDAARSRIRLSARRYRGYKRRESAVLIEVSDDGPGVDAQHRGQIFEPFFTTKAHGTGLGLAIARDLARLNGGDLELFSTSELGSTFCLYLEEPASGGHGSQAQS